MAIFIVNNGIARRTMSLHIIILAAGQGTRMVSSKPKVLHTIAGKPMLLRVIEVATQLNAEKIHVIYGAGGEQIKAALADSPVNWVLQEQQLGTGHAVMQALPHIPVGSHVLVLSADVPLIRTESLMQFVDQCQMESSLNHALGILVTTLADPKGLGRIIRDSQGAVEAIVEEKDANDSIRKINEIYSGICCAKAADLMRWLPQLSSDNAQKEYYLTEIIAMAAQEKMPIVSFNAEDSTEVLGVNTMEQLQQRERVWQQREAQRLMLSGVHIADAARIDIRGEISCGKNVFIDVNCVFEGRVVIGDGCVIAPNCVLKDVTLSPNCVVNANSVLEGSDLGESCAVGPFARLRPGTKLANHCKIGNFVETKNILVGENTKASHLSYLGDATIGQNVNIGAGTITCNYDGVNKHRTIIEDGVFVGSDTQFVAPVTIGKNATIGAGTTIRQNVPAGELAILDARQKLITGWKRPIKKNQE